MATSARKIGLVSFGSRFLNCGALLNCGLLLSCGAPSGNDDTSPMLTTSGTGSATASSNSASLPPPTPLNPSAVPSLEGPPTTSATLTSTASGTSLPPTASTVPAATSPSVTTPSTTANGGASGSDPGLGQGGSPQGGNPGAAGATPIEPEPTVAEPEPTAAEPEPTVAEPEPTAAEPEPTVAEPEPTTAEPEPSVGEPEPTVGEPEPTAAEPEPTAVEPEPVAEPEPVVEPEPEPGECSVPTPPAQFQETIDLTWSEMLGEFSGQPGARPPQAGVQNFTNAILDQLFEADGELRFCVRWDTDAIASAQLRDQIEAALRRGVNEWFSKLVGYDCFPFDNIPVKVTGWATRDRNFLDWTDDTVRIDVNDIREDAPQCQEACGRFFNRQAGYTYPNCPGGYDNHYDMSLWLTKGMQGGAGGDWGQRVGSEYFVGSVNNDHQHIWLHEFGHGLGFPDYYEWDSWAPGVAAPNSVMVAGAASLVTEWDTWMVRHLWTELKPRFQ